MASPINEGRPRVLCHMTVSLDGKVTGDFLSRPECAEAVEAYYALNREARADAYACGRVTMEGSFTGGFQPDLAPFCGIAVPEGDHVADPGAAFFAVAFDRQGRLGWTGPRIEDADPGYGGAHIVEVLCEGVPQERLAYLRSVGVSYLFAGKEGRLDLPLALCKLREMFGIRTLLLEGGGMLNGAFLREDLVDELSLVFAPFVAGAEDRPLFDVSAMGLYELAECRQTGAVPYLRYVRVR